MVLFYEEACLILPSQDSFWATRFAARCLTVEGKQLSLLVNPVLALNVVSPVIGLGNVQTRQCTFWCTPCGICQGLTGRLLQGP